MMNFKHLWLLSFSCLLSVGFIPNALAQENIAVLNQNIKAVASVSSGRYIKIAWTVKLQNNTSKPINCDVTIGFLNASGEKIEQARKNSTLEANEIKSVSDTILLKSDIAHQIASCSVSVDEK